MNLLKVDTVDQAREKIREHVKSWFGKSETISAENALGYILAENVISSCDIPSFRRSTVDGYAIKASETACASEAIPAFFKQKGSVSMGKSADFLIHSGECAYVPTGAMIPDGADAMVMVEYCETAGDTIAVYEAAAPGAGIAEIGEDFRGGNILLKKDTLIRPQEIGALSAAGITGIKVYVPNTISLISTGDELVPPGQNPRPGEIRDINTNAIRALAEKHGYKIISAQVLPDDMERLERAAANEMASSDIVLISGGSSQGEKDLTVKIIDSIAKPGVFTHGLALKPGKPTILGWDEESKTLFAGLPGHPVSAMIVFELLFGRQKFPIPAKLSCNVPGSPGKTVCLPVALHQCNGNYSAQPIFGKSGMISTLTNADGYIIIDLNREGLGKDESVLVHLL